MSKVRVNVVATKDDTQSVEVHRLVAAPDKIEALEGRMTTAETGVEAAVKRTSSTGAASMPVGSEAQRPGTAGNGMFRYNSDKHQFEGYQNGKWGAIGGGSHVLSVTWEPSRDILGEGFVAADGQTLSRATYPDAWAAINAGKVPVVDDSVWLSDPTQRGKFSRGDGSTTFRVPDYNGKSSGTLGAVFQRGDGALSAAIAGVIQQDSIKQHDHDLVVRTDSSALSGNAGGVDGPQGVVSGGSWATSTQSIYGVQPSGGNETRPLNVTGVWVIKLFGAVVNVGSADAAQLASDYANLAAQVQTAYKPSNLVGIVSQLAGVPTGAVIERGSNANGEYIRWADGTQLCWRMDTVDRSFPFAYGALFRTDILTFGFPAEFAFPPVVAPLCGSSAQLISGAINSVPTNVAVSIAATSAASTAIGRLGFFASGRWY